MTAALQPRSHRRRQTVAEIAQHERRERERATAEMIGPPETTWQAPLRPVWRLEWHPGVVIRPDRPAPRRYYRPHTITITGSVAGIGELLPFQDDLNAIADHGSSWILPTAAVGQARMSALA